MSIRRTWSWVLRVAVVLALFLVNAAMPIAADRGSCERCALCPAGELDLVPCCAPPIPGLPASDDCHDDDNECHLHGNPC